MEIRIYGCSFILLKRYLNCPSPIGDQSVTEIDISVTQVKTA